MRSNTSPNAKFDRITRGLKRNYKIPTAAAVVSIVVLKRTQGYRNQYGQEKSKVRNVTVEPSTALLTFRLTVHVKIMCYSGGGSRQ